jgi:hypothetical protein
LKQAIHFRLFQEVMGDGNQSKFKVDFIQPSKRKAAERPIALDMDELTLISIFLKA